MSDEEQTKQKNNNVEKYGMWLIFLLLGASVGLIIGLNSEPDMNERTTIFNEELCKKLEGTPREEFGHCSFSDRQLLYTELFKGGCLNALPR